jgi:hypothetical protein
VRASTPQHWQDFWEEAERHGLEDVYDNDGRLVREIAALFGGGTPDLTGRRILEVGAGTPWRWRAWAPKWSPWTTWPARWC